MNFVQISTSIEYGAYYYDGSTSQIYHVPYEDLLELNHVRFANLSGGLIGAVVVAIGMVEYAKNPLYGNNPRSLVLLPLVLLLSSCLFCWLTKRNQKRIRRLIRERYRAVSEDLDLPQIVKQGCKAYVQVSIYCVCLFFLAGISLSESASSILFAFFSIAFFDTGIMMLSILQPLGKLEAYFSLKRRCHPK